MSNKKTSIPIKLVSIIICTYNRAVDLHKTLTVLSTISLSPIDTEIIVVDDCSIDNTEEIVSSFNVHYIKNPKNSGIPFSRNAGLNAAKGEIVVYLDDDCLPSKEWLSELIKHYSEEKVMAVGGLVTAQDMKNITSLYMLAIGYGNTFIKRKKSLTSIPLFESLCNYIHGCLFTIADSKQEIHEVEEIYGANCSFLKKNVLAISGYDENFQTSEDSDICRRLKIKYPDRKILFSKKASAAHKHYTSFSFYLKVTFKRAEHSFTFHTKKNKSIPRIYPFPVLISFALILSFIIGKPLLALTLLAVPQALYFWWPLKLVKKLKIYFLLFPYMQLLLESAEMLGVVWAKLKGMFKKKKMTVGYEEKSNR